MTHANKACTRQVGFCGISDIFHTSAFSYSRNESSPAHLRVTQTVRRLRPKGNNMAKLFLYYLWVRLTERVNGVWLPSPSLAWEQARIAHKYAAQQSMHLTAGRLGIFKSFLARISSRLSSLIFASRK